MTTTNVEHDLLTQKIIGTCSVHGEFEPSEEYQSARRNHAREGWAFKLPLPRCPKCERETSEAADAERRIAAYQQARSDADIPPRFRVASLDNFVDTNESRKVYEAICGYAEDFEDYQARGAGMIWTGKAGTGKTHLACAVLQHVMWRCGVTARYTTALDASKRIKSTYGQGKAESEEQAIRYFTKPDLLVIDEIGIGYGSETELLHIWEIVSRRYNDVRPTILISNLAGDNTKQALGDRLMDRMREGGGILLPFNWASHRGQQAPATTLEAA